MYCYLERQNNAYSCFILHLNGMLEIIVIILRLCQCNVFVIYFYMDHES